jgi:hypothetical protein
MPTIVGLESLTTKSRFVTNVYKDNNGDGVMVGSENPLPIEDVTYLRLIEGRVFGAGVVRDFADPLPDGESIDIGIAFPAGVTPVVTFSGLCQGDALGFLYENASLSGGTPYTAINLNRASTNTSQAAITIAPTVNSLGTLVLKQILIGGAGKKAGGGEVGASSLILKPLTSYLIRLTNANSTDHAAEVLVEWFE